MVGGDFGNPREWWASEKKKKKAAPQCLVWFRSNGFGSSQNSQNSLIHN